MHAFSISAIASNRTRLRHPLGPLRLDYRRLPILCALLTGAPLVEADIQFADAHADRIGIDFRDRSFGAAWGDFNGDGWPDLWAGRHATSLPGLYINNRDGTFTDSLLEVWPEAAPIDAHGAAWADFDNDGDQDLLSLVGADGGNGSNPNLFLLNEGGLFREAALPYGIDYPLGRGRMPLWLDWDNDGMLDVFVANDVRPDGQAPSAVFMQRGTTFQVLDSLVTNGHTTFAQAADLFGQGESLLLIEDSDYPDSVFAFDQLPIDLRADIGLPPSGAVSDVAIEDFNGDLRPDFYFARYKGRESEVAQPTGTSVGARIVIPANSEKGVQFATRGVVTFTILPTWKMSSHLIRIGARGTRPGDNTFTLSPNDPAVQGIATHTPGVDLGAYVGWDPLTGTWKVLLSSPDVRPVNILAESTLPVDSVKTINFKSTDPGVADQFLVQTDSGFADTSISAGFGASTACPAVAAGDFDNDMDVDLYLACTGTVTNFANLLYENLGGGRFRSVPQAGGAAGTLDGRADAVAVADYNNDGFLDLFVANGLGAEPLANGPYELFRNLGNGNHWLQLDLVGTVSNRDGIGASVYVTAGGVTQLRQRRGGIHSEAQDYQRIHVGLAQNTLADVEVRWPSGLVDQFNNVAADRILTVVEGSGAADTNAISRTLSVANVTVDENAGVAEFAVRLVPAPGRREQIDVGYVTADGTALAGSDYLARSGLLSFFSGQSEQIVQVPIIDDADPEVTEQLTLTVTGAGMTAATASATILDNDPRVSGCGAPTYNPARDAGLYLWEENCGSATRSFAVRASAGGQNTVATYGGQVNADQPLSAVTPYLMEPADILQVLDGGQRLRYQLSVEQIYEDGFSFNAAAGTRVCFGMDLPAGTRVLVGPKATPVSAPFDLTTYQACELTPPPVGICGTPLYSPAVNPGFYLWEQNCEGGTREYVVYASPGGIQYVTYAGQVSSDQAFSRVAGYSLETDDTVQLLNADRQLSYRLNVQRRYQDGFTFAAADGARVCFGMDLPPGTPVLVGPNATPVTSPFSLPDLGACTP